MVRGVMRTVLALAALAVIAGCSKGGQTASETNTVSNTVAVTNTTVAAPAPAAPAAFDPAGVPVTTVSLPPPPFFTIPEGLESTFADKDKLIPYDAQWFMAGDKPTRVEGKIWRERFNLAAARPYSSLEFLKNYENAITALGGKKISTSNYTYPIIDSVGGRDALEKTNYAASMVPDYPHDSYMLRTPDKEYWIDVSVGSFPSHGYVVVLEKTGMTQSVAFLDASAMKKAIDEKGRVALHINFDVDKATLRPDAQPTIAEINKLLTSTPALKLSIEGHTDNTGEPAHNRELSAARARMVLGTLIGLGVDPARLTSTGFGADKPVASNATDAGRAENRRVELVRR